MAKLGKERPKLKALPVKVLDFKIENVPAREGSRLKEDKEVIHLLVEHPDKEEAISLSKVKYERGNKVVTGSLWNTLDDEGNISYDSALGNLLRFFGVDDLEGLKGKTLMTSQDSESGFLVIRAY